MSVERPDPPTEGGPLNIGLLCFIVSRAMEDRVLGDLAAAGFDDVTVAQARVFARIGPKGTRVTELGEQARVTKQTAGFLVDQLERAGYVRRVPDPTDGRRSARRDRGTRPGRCRARPADGSRRPGRVDALPRPAGHGPAARTLSRLREITDPYG